MSAVPGPNARPPSSRKGRSAAVPAGKTVSRCARRRSPPAPPPWNRPTIVSPSRPSGSGSIETPAPSRSRKAAVQRPTRFTPSGLYVPLSTPTRNPRSRTKSSPRLSSQAARAGSSDGGATPDADSSDGGAAAASPGRSIAASIPYPRRTVRLVEIRLLEGPNIYRLEPAVRIEDVAGRASAWRGSRLPPPAEWVALGRHLALKDVPAEVARVARGGAFLSQRPDARTGGGQAHRPGVAVHRSADPGHWVVTYGWTRAGVAHEIRATAVPLPQRRARRAPDRQHHVRRRARGRPARRVRRLDRPTRSGQGPRSRGHRPGGSRDCARRDPASRGRVRV